MKMPQKSCFVSIMGRPNVGKSTLLNALLGEKVAIVSSKPQTTRNRITGILTEGERQYVFIDTPGLHKPRTLLGEYMMKAASSAAGDTDVVLFVTECDRKLLDAERAMLESFAASGTHCILVVNKTDKISKAALAQYLSELGDLSGLDSVVPVSALNKDGTDIIFRVLEPFMVESPHFFPDDMITDQPERQIVAEIIREKMLWNLEREIPHGTAVEITKFSERDDGVIEIDATIYCEKASHKGIIIGKQGAMLKKISTMARHDCERFLGAKIYLQTWVKVKENWRDNPNLIRNFGYHQDR